MHAPRENGLLDALEQALGTKTEKQRAASVEHVLATQPRRVQRHLTRSLDACRELLAAHPDALTTQLRGRLPRTASLRSVWAELDARPGLQLRSRGLDAPAPLVTSRKLHTALVHRIAVGPDSVAYSAGEDGRLLAFDASTLSPRHTFAGHSGPINTLALSADGLTLVSGGDDHAVRVWSTASGECIRTIEEHTDYVRDVAIAGDVIVSGAQDCLLKIHDAHSGVCRHAIRFPEHVMAVALSPDGKVVASASLDNSLRLHDTTTGALLRTLYGGPESPVLRIPGFSSLYIASDNTSGVGHRQTPVRLAFSPDGTTLYSAEKDVIAWHVDTGAWRHVAHDGGWANDGLALDGDRLALGSYGLRLVDVNTGERLLTMGSELNGVTALALDGHGGLLVGMRDGEVSRWSTARSPRRPGPPHAGHVNNVKVSNDRAATHDVHNGVVLWNTHTGRRIAALDAVAEANGSDFAFSPDGERLATSSPDGVRVWSARDGVLLHDLRRSVPSKQTLHALAFEPDGSLLVGSGHDSLERWFLDGRIEPLAGFARQSSAMIVSQDGSIAIGSCYFGTGDGHWTSASSRLVCWDLHRSQVRWMQAWPPYTSGAPALDGLSMSPDGQRIVSSSNTRKNLLERRDAATGAVVWKRAVPGLQQTGQLADGRLWFSASQGRGRAAVHLLTILGLDDERVAHTSELPAGVMVLEMSTDGRRALLRQDMRLVLWDVRRSRSLGHVDVDAGGFHAAMSPDGRTVVVGDQRGRVWILRTPRRRRPASR